MVFSKSGHHHRIHLLSLLDWKGWGCRGRGRRVEGAIRAAGNAPYNDWWVYGGCGDGRRGAARQGCRALHQNGAGVGQITNLPFVLDLSFFLLLILFNQSFPYEPAFEFADHSCVYRVGESRRACQYGESKQIYRVRVNVCFRYSAHFSSE